jgi:protein-S-isoprenylcysteine O-methyltransferase Ste14
MSLTLNPPGGSRQPLGGSASHDHLKTRKRIVEMTSVEKPEEEKVKRHLVLRALLQLTILLPILSALLFIPAGRLDWVMGWVVLGAYLVGLGLTNLLVSLRNPELARERADTPATAKKWDRILTNLANLPTLLMLPIAGLDIRFGWSPRVGWSVQLMALVVFVLGYALFGWAMMANRFFSSLIRIQKDRGHVVVSSGPYRYIRHPGYLGMIAMQLSAPLALGSLWAMVFGGISRCLYIVRTVLEDKTLQEELVGYREYVKMVHYRLIPRVW